MISDERLAVNRDVAARVAGLSMRQLDYWAATGLLGPEADERPTPGRRVRLYGFEDLLGLMVAARLKARKVSLQHIRQIVDHLRSRGYERPLTELVWATEGNRVYFQHSDGSWEGDLRPDQTVLSQVLNLSLLREALRQQVTRSGELSGSIERRRGALGGKPVLAGTRVPVETVRRYIESGKSDDDIVASFPILTVQDVQTVRSGAVA